ncbi:hypothetical protein BDP27DRAFT_1428823 [Rhodocollybia butyracea]|uniref:Uncharacterized protein n=1 Tax=Rhodocollybia butyracea TaxID=206335 RepID=A0A9P5PCW0_9AGAR|nr:hypothetical protein BDP27DRAFT_1431588 [Rhodocollybia butyracea]KAF9061523.1 hypothetical protein BDP27DRAFT_1428823 [Rhodocollybia butyracea]
MFLSTTTSFLTPLHSATFSRPQVAISSLSLMVSNENNIKAERMFTSCITINPNGLSTSAASSSPSLALAAFIRPFQRVIPSEQRLVITDVDASL